MSNLPKITLTAQPDGTWKIEGMNVYGDTKPIEARSAVVRLKPDGKVQVDVKYPR